MAEYIGLKEIPTGVLCRLRHYPVESSPRFYRPKMGGTVLMLDVADEAGWDHNKFIEAEGEPMTITIP